RLRLGRASACRAFASCDAKSYQALRLGGGVCSGHPYPNCSDDQGSGGTRAGTVILTDAGSQGRRCPGMNPEHIKVLVTKRMQEAAECLEDGKYLLVSRLPK